jgi:ribosome-associated protein
LDSEQLAKRITECIFSKKGYDVKILDLKKLTTISDYFVICSADSDTQVKAIADAVDKELRDEGIKSWHREGLKGLNWVLLDYVDVVVHVFKKDTREYYNLEKLWGDAFIIDVEDPAMKALVTPVKRKPGRPRKTDK